MVMNDSGVRVSRSSTNTMSAALPNAGNSNGGVEDSGELNPNSTVHSYSPHQNPNQLPLLSFALYCCLFLSQVSLHDIADSIKKDYSTINHLLLTAF